MMNLIYRNYRGLGSPRAVNGLKRIISLETPQVVFLSETKLKHHEMGRVREKLLLKNLLVVECTGEERKRSGGLALLWKHDIDITIPSFSMNHIDAWMNNHVQGGWRFTCIYGFPEEEQKLKTKVLMEKLNEEQQRPWLCGGDFNLMLLSSEKKGGNGFKVNEAETFREAIESCHMMDLGFNGHEFTWTNNRAGEHNVQERLDRFLANQLWKDLFPGSFVTHLSRRRSDHLPIMLCLKGYPRAKNERKKKKLFKFEEMWLKENMCEEIIKEAWQSRGSFCSKLEETSTQLIRWSKETFGSFAREMRDCKKIMEKLMEMEPTEEVIAQMRAVDDRLDELESKEEVYWRQRSRQTWLKSGDKNTNFFHAMANQRRETNHIDAIQDEGGNTYEEEEQISESFASYYEQLFKAGDQVEIGEVVDKKRVGMGAIMRDREGDVMASTCKQILGEYDVEVAEALAARHALQVALEIGLTKIILEVDNLKLCQYLKKDKKEPTGFGKIVQDIKEGNKVAHHLAKLSGNFGELRVWIEEVPELVQCHVLSDLLSSNE
ncbi:LINE-1 retrotransposable element ORF2 protein [Bienertia sinuspersici]